MSVADLRRAGALDAQFAETLEGVVHGNLRIESVERRDWEPFIEEYPYPEQTVVKGSAIYNVPLPGTEVGEKP